MLEKPDIPDSLILARLREGYDLCADQVTFLPLGADVNTAVYRVDVENGQAYFLKLRKGPFEEITVTLPHFLQQEGLKTILSALETRASPDARRRFVELCVNCGVTPTIYTQFEILPARLWEDLGEYKMILYPFIEGQDGYQVSLSNGQWRDFGASLRMVHDSMPPPQIHGLIPRETYDARWRNRVKGFQEQVESKSFREPVAAKLAAFMRAQREEISRLVALAEELGANARARDLPLVICHADLHPGNLLINPGGAFYIVDWDNPILAPRERDLMFIGAGIGGSWDEDHAEALFYQGYGPAQVDRAALAYYRCERIVEDIAAFCEQLLETDAGGEDREQSYRYFTSNFLPGHEIDRARKTWIKEV